MVLTEMNVRPFFHDGQPQLRRLLYLAVSFHPWPGTLQYHPVTGRPVFLRMVIEDGEGRALKFRTRTRPDYARIRPGMVAEAVLVSACILQKLLFTPYVRTERGRCELEMEDSRTSGTLFLGLAESDILVSCQPARVPCLT